MAIQKINLGTEPHGVGGDSYRTANDKINKNFEEVSTNITSVDEKYSNTEVKITEEVARAKQAEDELKANLEKEVSRAVSAEADILGVVESESRARTAEDVLINEAQTQLKGFVDSEVEKLKLEDTSIKTGLEKTHRYAVMSQTLGLGSKFYDKDGQPLSGGKVYTYEAGTSTPLDTYKDAGFSIPNANPIVLDETGSADVFLKGTYRFRIFDKSDSFVEEQDNVSQLVSRAEADSINSDITIAKQDLIEAKTEIEKVKKDTGIEATPKFEGAISRTQADKNTQLIDVSDFVNFDDTDHTAGLKAAVAAAKSLSKNLVCRDTRTLKVSDVVDLKNISEIDIKSNILCITPEAQLIIGGMANTMAARDIKFRNIENSSSVISGEIPSKPLLVVTGVKGGSVSVGNCNYMQILADGSSNTTSSNAYTKYYLNGAMRKLELTDVGRGSPWVNENQFYGGRVFELHIVGKNYQHNHNKFYNTTFETSRTRIVFDNTYNNILYDVRAEQFGESQVVYFSESASNNKIIVTWAGTGKPETDYNVSLLAQDLGVGNSIISYSAITNDIVEISCASANTIPLANSYGSTSILSGVNPQGEFAYKNKGKFKPELLGFTADAGRWVILTDLIPVSNGDVVLFNADYEGVTGRVYVFAHGEGGKLLKDVTGGIKGVGVSLVGNSFGYTTPKPAAYMSSFPMMVNSGLIKFVRIGVLFDAETFVKHISIKLATSKSRVKSLGMSIKPKNTQAILDTAPTMGHVPVGTQVYDSYNGKMLIATRQHRSYLNADVNAGGTTLTVDDIGSVENGDIYGVLMDNGRTQWGKVAGLTSKTFTVSALPYKASENATVVFNKWKELATSVANVVS